MSMHIEIGTRSGQVTNNFACELGSQEALQAKTESVAKKNSPGFLGKVIARISRAFGISDNDSTKKIQKVTERIVDSGVAQSSELNARNPFIPDDVRNMKPLSSAAPICIGIDKKGNPIYQQLHTKDNDDLTRRRFR